MDMVFDEISCQKFPNFSCFWMNTFAQLRNKIYNYNKEDL